MNRNALCDIPKPHLPKLVDTFCEPPPELPQVGHSVFVPLHYEKKYSYPLVVWLHGSADDQGQLKKVMPHISMRNFIGISPCGTELIADELHTDGYLGYTWQQEAADITLAFERVSTCIATAKKRFNVNASKVFLAGCDDGGTMALRLGDALSGIVCWCGIHRRKWFLKTCIL